MYSSIERATDHPLRRMVRFSPAFWRTFLQPYHCSYSLSHHFVFVTKYRRKCFTGAMLDRLKEVVATLCVDWQAELVEMNGQEDHVHFPLGLNPKYAPSVVVNHFKTVTSRRLRKALAALRAKFKEPVLWSRRYFVASGGGGAPLSVIKQYIEPQARPLLRRSLARAVCAALYHHPTGSASPEGS